MSNSCVDRRFPACNPVDIVDPIFRDTVRVPAPPTFQAWTDFLLSQQKPEFPIPATPPTVTGSPYRGGAPTTNGIPWGHGNPTTEMYMCDEAQTWAFTYDDGPFSLTEDFLVYLRSMSIKATFFVIGANVVRNPEYSLALQSVYDDGHQIATHPRMTTQSNDHVMAEIVWNMLAVKSVIGRYPRYFRFPYGDMDDRMRAIIHSLGLRAVHWNVLADDSSILPGDTGAWKIQNAVDRFTGTIANRSMAGLDWLPGGPPYPSFISLQHETQAEHLTVAERVTPRVLEAGYRPVLVSECESALGREYLDELTDPFAIFLNGIRLPVVVDASGNISSTSAEGGWSPLEVAPRQPKSAVTSVPKGGSGIDRFTVFGIRGGKAVGVVGGMIAVGILAFIALGMFFFVYRRRGKKRDGCSDEGKDDEEKISVDGFKIASSSGNSGGGVGLSMAQVLVSPAAQRGLEAVRGSLERAREKGSAASVKSIPVSEAQRRSPSRERSLSQTPVVVISQETAVRDEPVEAPGRSLDIEEARSVKEGGSKRTSLEKVGGLTSPAKWGVRASPQKDKWKGSPSKDKESKHGYGGNDLGI
ncbi:chitin deacetylase [Dinochytrium kinnereticum]|nr:chitin deacetylase [Dinochytrium kinnereticum]